MHDTQLPLLHTLFGSQEVPFATLPLATQACEPLSQEVVPVLQEEGLHDAPAVQETQSPPLQTLFRPQPVPSVSAVPVSPQVELPVSQEVCPE